MRVLHERDAAWPALDYAASRDTLATRRLWSQTVGEALGGS